MKALLILIAILALTKLIKDNTEGGNNGDTNSN